MTLPAPMTPEYLRAWGRHTHGSPLYARLVDVTASSPKLMAVIGQVRHRPPPNVYLAAIHFLLMDGGDSDLAGFYPSLVDDPMPVEDVGPVFTRFVVENQGAILELANTRYTQTNECRRCVALMPAILTAPYDAFHIVDLGTSAGLNLAFDRYRYDFGVQTWGPESPVVLSAEVKGHVPRTRPVEVLRRIGLDLNIVDPTDPMDRRWLDALIWPEHQERRDRLRAALTLASTVDMDMVEGDFVDLIPEVLATLPSDEPVVVVNSFSLIQLDESVRRDVARSIDAARTDRPLYRVSLEFIDKTDDWARLQVGAELDLVQLGTAHHHGEWVDLDYQVLP